MFYQGEKRLYTKPPNDHGALDIHVKTKTEFGIKPQPDSGRGCGLKLEMYTRMI